MSAICTVDGCTRPRRSPRSDMCEGHYHRVRRTGNVGTAPLGRPRRRCTAAGCDRPHYAHGYCQFHGRRVAAGGRPDYVRDRSGSNNPSWVGDDAGYSAAHERVAKERGKARQHACVTCGGRARHWSYRHDDPNERTTERGYAYSLDVTRYDPKCVSCHKRADLARLGMLRDDRERVAS